MRVLFLLRGAPGSGKSTWIHTHNLEPYTLSADDIRTMYQGPAVRMDGSEYISQSNDGKVWSLLFRRLEERMMNGEFLIVDATHYKRSLLNKYKKLSDEYRYRVYIVDFTDVPEETALQRNKLRDEYKVVPEEVIHKMYSVFRDDTEVSKRYTILSRDDAIHMLSRSESTGLVEDYNHFNKLVVFGDIHGCYEPLSTYFKDHPMEDSTCYIFLGDYLDRGLQNKDVLEWLLNNCTRKNVILLEGNHEKWLRLYSSKGYTEIPKENFSVLKRYGDLDTSSYLASKQIRSRVFSKYTVPDIEDLPKKDIRQLCRKFRQVVGASFRGKTYFMCHGGFSNLPSIFTPTQYLIHGVGGYEDTDDLYQEMDNHKDIVFIHGHRNVLHHPTKVNSHIYNLCSDVEYGDDWRVLEIDDSGVHTLEIPNPVHAERPEQESTQGAVPVDPDTIIAQLNKSKLICKKDLDGGIVSYNFTRKAFRDRKWNDLTCTARGLFLEKDTGKIVCRSYNKFFNWGERPQDDTDALAKSLVFPVTSYYKENGFLAIISYYKDDLLVCSKSSNAGTMVQYIKDTLSELPKSTLDRMTAYLKAHDVTMVFECIRPKEDPHIIKYDRNDLILLDIIDNTWDCHKMNYDDMVQVAKGIGLDFKKRASIYTSFEDLYSDIKGYDTNNYIHLEGWVFEDAKGYMVKYKTPYYKFWKRMRNFKEIIEKSKGDTIQLPYDSDLAVRTIKFMEDLNKQNSLSEMSIIDIRDVVLGV